MLRIYVGNLSYSTTEQSLTDAFSAYGQVDEVTIPMDRATGRSRGFGFVQMPNPEEGKKAIEALNGSELDGRTLTVNEARERQPKPAYGGGGGGGGFGGGGRGGYGGGGGGGGRGGYGGGRGGGRGGDRDRDRDRSW